MRVWGDTNESTRKRTQSNCVETAMELACGSMEILSKGHGTRIPLENSKNLAFVVKSGAATPISDIDNFVKHIDKEHNQESDDWANIGGQ